MVQLLPDVEELLYLSPYDLISLKDVGLPGGALAMRPLNLAHVADLVESNVEDWPSIRVTLSIRGYILIDGYHRWEAAKLKEVPRFKATCEAYGSEFEVVEEAFRANFKHGLKTTLATKGDYAYWLHSVFPTMEQLEIAQKVGLSQSAVSKAIARREQALQGAALDQEAQQKAIKRSCRNFTKTAMHFLDEVDVLSDEELTQLLKVIVKKREDRDRLARIGRLFSVGQSSSTTGPLRLRQFVPPTTGNVQEA